MNPGMGQPKIIPFGTRLRMERAKQNLMLKDVSARSGVSVSTIWRIEQNRVSGRVELGAFVAVCTALQVSPHEVLCGSENWNPKEVAI